jgi:hypothetical protein
MEISGYKSSGYEIVYYNSGGINARQSLDGWKRSGGHNQVLLNEGPWLRFKWKAIGVCVGESYSAVWFGELKDTGQVINCP